MVLPPGVCMVSEALGLRKGAGITVAGGVSSGGKLLTTITDPVNPADRAGDLSIRSDHNTVDDLVLDQSHYGMAAWVRANYNIFRDVTTLGGPNSFALFFVPQAGGAKSEHNQLLYATVVSLIDRLVLGGDEPCDDGLVWAGQDQSLIRHLNFTGTRLALYEDSDTAVDGFTYHPGPQTCGLDGYYITQPSVDITMTDLVMYGSGGVIGNGGTTNGMISNVSISRETVRPAIAGDGFILAGSSHPLLIRNVRWVKILDSNLDSGVADNSGIKFVLTTRARDVLVEDSTLVRIAFWGTPASVGVAAAGTHSMYLDDTFPAYGFDQYVRDTFVNGSGAPVAFTVEGGSWSNLQPTEAPYEGFFHGANTTFAVKDLVGYP